MLTPPFTLSPASRLVVLRDELALLEEDLVHLANAQYTALEAVVKAVKAGRAEGEIEALRTRYAAATAQYAAVYDTQESVMNDINRLTERSRERAIQINP